jgi:dTDP-4-amino-4,6-dideoxygalactose transaminase
MEYIMPAPLSNSIDLADTVLCLPVYEKIEKPLQETLLQAFEDVFKSLSLGN